MLLYASIILQYTRLVKGKERFWTKSTDPEADGVGDVSGVVLWSTVLRLWVSRTSVLQSSVWRLTRASVVSLVRELPETLYFTICPFRKTDPIGLVPMVKQVCG